MGAADRPPVRSPLQLQGSLADITGDCWRVPELWVVGVWGCALGFAGFEVGCFLPMDLSVGHNNH